MTNKIYFACMIAMLAISLIAGGCSKNDSNNPQEPAKAQKYHMVVNAAKAQDHATNTPRRVLGMDGTTVNASWAAGEEVTVYNVTRNTAVSGVLTAQSSGARTTLSGDLTGIIEPSDILTLKFRSPDYTGQDGTLEYISSHCDYAEASVTVASVSGGNITSAADAVFENKQAVVRFTLMDKADGSTLLNPTSFTINDGTNDIVTLTDIPAATYTTNGNGVLFVSIPGFADKTITLTASNESDVYVCTKENVTFANGSYYPITTKMTETIHNGALSGEFSVSPTKRVRFSRGNLQYQASTDTWRFAENQYDFIGKNNFINPQLMTRTNPPTSFSTYYWQGTELGDVIDLFAWSSDKDLSRVWGIESSSDDVSKFYGNFMDWGVNINDSWYTMSINEWDFIISERENASELIAVGTINGINGCILLPDNWQSPNNITFNSGTANENDSILYSTINNYSIEEWSIMENAGAVFLPSSGDRSLPHMYTNWSNFHGTYWSATIIDTKSAYTFSVKPNYAQIDKSWYYIGRSVRLVQDIE